MKTHLTHFQLFFLTFLYVFSGTVLSDITSPLSFLFPLTVSILWAVVGYRGALQKREDMTDFLSAYLPRRETVIPLAVFIFSVSAEAVLTILDVATVFWGRSDFIPFPLILTVFFGTSMLITRKGMTVLGRVSELSLFLLVPLVILRLFGSFHPMDMVDAVSVLRLVFSVMPAPIFFLLSMTVVSGDVGISGGFRATGYAPKNRAAFLIGIVALASAVAVLLRAFLLTFPLAEKDLLAYFLEYTAHAVKISLLFSILAHGYAKEKKNHAVICGICTAVAVVLTLAIKGGAVFSPFMWIFLLVSLNLTVGLMLCIFAQFPIV